MDASENILTAAGRRKLEEELAHREGELRSQILEKLKAARAFGDLSENAEYDAAKEEQGQNETRIAEIRNALATAQDADESDGAKVFIGSTVSLVDADGVASEVTIVGTKETKSLMHRISNESPLGRALINHSEGETVGFVTPSGKKRSYTIVKISN